MGWLDRLFKKATNRTKYAQMLNGYTPIFSQFGKDIFASDVVQQAVSCIVNELLKLKPTHIIRDGDDLYPVGGNIQKVLNNPNQLMAKTDFLEKVGYMLMYHYNAFIIQVHDTVRGKDGKDKRVLRALYPVNPSYVEFVEDALGNLYVTMKFANGYETTIPKSDVIHVRYRYSVNEFMGGNLAGEPDHEALLKTLQINEDLLEGVAKGIRSSFSINGVIKFKTMIDEEKTMAAVKELEKKIMENQSGFMPLDLSGEYIPIERDVKLVDPDTLKFIDEKILRHFGVSLPILTGEYNPEQYEAFYQKTLEPIIAKLRDAFTYAIFSDKAISHGNEIAFYPKDLIFMSMEQTLEMIRLLGDSGALYENEKRTALGLRPLPELVGVRMQSLNYVNVNIADKYQIGEIDNAKDDDGEDTE